MKISLFIMSLFLLGCSKKDNNQNGQKKCYTIIFISTVGGPACERKSPLDTCIDPWVNVSSLKFVDKCNNDLSWMIR